MKKFLISAAIAALAMAAPASAVLLAPGAVTPADTLVVPPPGPFSLLVTTSQNDLSDPNGHYTGTFRQSVFRDTTNQLLAFVYQLNIPSAVGGFEGVNEISVSNFGGFTVNAFQIQGDVDGAGFLMTGTDPFTFFRRSAGTGSTVAAQFGPGNSLVQGETSYNFVLFTNAVNYAQGGTFTSQNGGVAAVTAFQPTAVPEPATWALMIGGFGVVGGAMRRSRKAKMVTA